MVIRTTLFNPIMPRKANDMKVSTTDQEMGDLAIWPLKCVRAD